MANAGIGQRAVGWARRAVELDPQHAGAHFELGRLLRVQGYDDQALLAFERAVELDNFHLPAMTSVAELYAGRGELARADSMIDRALDLNIADSRRRVLERLRASWR